jgi:hypothetical protein
MNDVSELKLPEKSDYQLLFETCIKDLAYAKDQQWKTVHLTLIGLGAVLVAIHEGIMQGSWAYVLVSLVAVTGSIFMCFHHKALIKHRKQKGLIIEYMPTIYDTIHPCKKIESKGGNIKNMIEDNKKNWDIALFSLLFFLIIILFAIFVILYAIKDC